MKRERERKEKRERERAREREREREERGLTWICVIAFSSVGQYCSMSLLLAADFAWEGAEAEGARVSGCR